MHRSEEPYLRELVENLPTCDVRSVLEVGYGLGIVARLIEGHFPSIERHEINEIEEAIYNNCRVYAQKLSKIRPLLGDFYEYDFQSPYDLLFYDPYDYELVADDSEKLKDVCQLYRDRMRERAAQLLTMGGILCHPYFGNMDMPLLPGFDLEYRGMYSGPPLVLWDGTKTNDAQIGYYRKTSETA